MLKTQVTEQNKFFNTNIYNSDYLMKFIKGEVLETKILPNSTILVSHYLKFL
jgi:hypothetical protein